MAGPEMAGQGRILLGSSSAGCDDDTKMSEPALHESEEDLSWAEVWGGDLLSSGVAH